MRYFLAALGILLYTQVLPAKCKENRAAISIGATNSQLVIAEIDFCDMVVSKFHIEKEVTIDFLGQIKKGGPIISTLVQLNAISALKKLVNIAKKYNPSDIIAIPSKFFKSTTNYMSFFKKLKQDLNVKIFLPDLKTEAILRYLGVKIKYPKLKSRLMVWDMGANGSDWTVLDENLDFKVYFEKISPYIFKNMVIEGVLKENHKKVSTPNPLGKKHAHAALELIKTYTEFNTPPQLKKFAKDFKVVGIGGFHNNSILKQISKLSSGYDLLHLQEALKKQMNLGDSEIGGPFPSFQVTNIILALGYFNTLNIDQISTTKVNEAHGSLIYQKFWKKNSK